MKEPDPFRILHDVKPKKSLSLSRGQSRVEVTHSCVDIGRWWTHWSSQRDTVHMDSPSLCPANSSRTPWQHRLRSRWSIPSSPRHLPGNGRPGSSSQSGCLRTRMHVRPRSINQTTCGGVLPTQPTPVGLSSKSTGH